MTKQSVLLKSIRLACCAAAFAGLVAALWFPTAWAQEPAPLPTGDQLQGLDILGGGSAIPGLDNEVFVTAQFTAPQGEQPGKLSIVAEIKKGWHIYAITQGPGGGKPAEILLDPSDKYRVTGEFLASPPPKKYFDEIFTAEVETHEGKVTWTAPIEFSEGVDPTSQAISGKVDLQACETKEEGKCVPLVIPFNAGFATAKDFQVGQYVYDGIHAVIRGHLEPRVARPGDTVKLVITAEPAAGGWHIYALEPTDRERSYKPTLIVVDESSFPITRPTTDMAPIESSLDLGTTTETLRYFEQPVTWTGEITIPTDAKPGEYKIAGIVGYQTCRENTCDLPTSTRFEAMLPVAEEEKSGWLPLKFTSATYAEAARLAEKISYADDEPDDNSDSEPLSAATLAWLIGSCLLGGLILNLMPCVLPVIGLKVLGFVEQAGHSRLKVLALNLWFTAGVMIVFLALGTLAAFANIGFGELFTFTWFKVALTALVFAMGLSFLGVWEIPIPGFAGRGPATELAAREGMGGAFWKGAFSTVLATPCSGPLLGPVLGFTLNQPPFVSYIVFGSIGLGMSLPYLAIGAFPSLIRFLPRPGAWMDTFKQVMGFLLMGTVVYLFSTISEDYFIPTLALCVALWFGCWLIGRTPLTASATKRTVAWIAGLGTAAVIGFGSFYLMRPYENWVPYSPAALAQAQAEGKTVMVDFTADWCPTCKWNLAWAINTRKVHDLAKENDVVLMIADWTDRSEEIKSKLASLGSRSIPLLAIYPAEKPDNPIVLRDLLTQQEVLEALNQAGPSKAMEEKPVAAPATATASN